MFFLYLKNKKLKEFNQTKKTKLNAYFFVILYLYLLIHFKQFKLQFKCEFSFYTGNHYRN